jgi:dTDP-4-dehydrorhamnose reductase
MRILITGATGSLGRRVYERAAAAGHDVTGTRVAADGDGLLRLDIRDRDAVLALVRRVRPDAIVHAAAGRDGLDPAAVPARRSPGGRPRDVRLVVEKARSVLRTRLRGATEFLEES